MDNAVRQMFTVSKESALKEEQKRSASGKEAGNEKPH